MIKNYLFAAALLSLALAAGCAKGGNGLGSGIAVTINVIPIVYPGQSVTFTAKVTGTMNTAVTWSLSGGACTGSPNPCGTINSTTGVYQAPATPPTPSAIAITATSQADTTANDSLVVNVALSSVVTPTTVTVGQGLTQQFTAIAVPDDAPQTFSWNLTCANGANCGTIQQDATTSGLAVYTAPSSPAGGVVVTATSPAQPAAGAYTAAASSKITVAPIRLSAGSYAFRFSGFDSSNNPFTAAGSFTLGSNSLVTTGFEDVCSAPSCAASGPQQYPIATVSLSPVSNSNNLGVLTVALSGGATNTYTAVLTSSGMIRMIESDGLGTGSGVVQKSAGSPAFNNGAQTFVFGFAGVDSSGKRVGYAGLLPMDGNGNITGGMLDANDNGSATRVCGSPPCSVSGTYQLVTIGVWHMNLTSGTATLGFDFFVSAGTVQTETSINPLTLYAISTDPVDATHPALSGSMVYQVPMSSGYSNAAFNNSSVSSLTGTNANVALINGTTDGTSSGTGGTGSVSGNFDQNDNGTILSVSSFPLATAPSNLYTYVASSGSKGRYTFQMLGNPNATPAVAPLPFVLYASGADRGFLLDQSSPAVMTGTMDPQLAPAGLFGYTASELPGTYAAGTVVDRSSTLITPVVENLLLTSTGGGKFNVEGTLNGSQPLSGAYTLMDTGVGGLTLTSPPPPAVATSVIYVIDAVNIPNHANPSFPNAVITDFMMMGTMKGIPSSIIFAQQ